jgi:hypothetical protein
MIAHNTNRIRLLLRLALATVTPVAATTTEEGK